MKEIFSFRKAALYAALLVSLSSCNDIFEEVTNNSPGYSPKLDIPFYALEDGVRLAAFSANYPQSPASAVAITGLQMNETILAMDFRPATGQLYGLGSTSRIYIINPQTGVARAVSATPFTPVLSGNIAGFDFNPTVDRIRVVTSNGQNLRLNPETGTVANVDGNINGIPGARVAAVAYTSNVAGATTTTLYDIDVTKKALYKQMPPNDGTLVEVGPLNLTITGEGGFDIAPKSDKALGLFKVAGKSTLFSVDLATGKASIITAYAKGYTGIAIPTQSVAYGIGFNNTFLTFNLDLPLSAVGKAITGLQAGERIVGIDFRPANSQLYAVSSGSRIYTLNASSGAATLVASLGTPLAGTSFGVDFNPVADRIRIISNTGQNLRVNPADGVTVVDSPLNPGTPSVTAAAYTNSFAGTTSTTLYDIDSNTDKLYIQNPPNNGTLVEVGNLGVNVEAANGFDIGGTSGMAYGVFTSGTAASLYRIDLNTGAATRLTNFLGAPEGLAVGPGF
ncbi:MAG TPA: DUF4394 domain-containing protein [Hymenobacter sp.]|jgi:hypothetical protein